MGKKRKKSKKNTVPAPVADFDDQKSRVKCAKPQESYLTLKKSEIIKNL